MQYLEEVNHFGICHHVEREMQEFLWWSSG